MKKFIILICLIIVTLTGCGEKNYPTELAEISVDGNSVYCTAIGDKPIHAEVTVLVKNSDTTYHSPEHTETFSCSVQPGETDGMSFDEINSSTVTILDSKITLLPTV